MLSTDEKNELLNKHISKSLMCKFFDILSNIGFHTQCYNVNFADIKDVTPKVDKRQLYLQVLPDDTQSLKCHWVLFKYAKKGTVYVFDSLNRNIVTSLQKQFLEKALCQKVQYQYKAVQMQNEAKDCGALVMAYTISLLLERNIENEVFLLDEIRPHLLRVIQNKLIVPCKSFSYFNTDDVDNNNKVSDQIEQKIEFLQINSFYDEGITKNMYQEVNYQFDDDLYKYISIVEEVVDYDYEVVEVFPSLLEHIEIEHSYASTGKRKTTDNRRTTLPMKKVRSTALVAETESTRPVPDEEILIGHRLEMQNETISEHYCGKLMERCVDCGALHFEKEKPSDKKFKQCCNKGKIKIQQPKSLSLINELLTNTQHEHHKIFLANIRKYNSAVSFASCGAQIVTPPGYGPYCFKIHGQIYHKTSHGYSDKSSQIRKYAQLYFIDTEEAVNERLQINCNRALDKELLKELDLAIRSVNPYAQAYKMLKEIHTIGTSDDVSLFIRKDRNLDCRRFNLPNSNEIAVIFKSDDGAPPFDRDICVYPRAPDNKFFIHIDTYSSNLDPMCYTLIFPYGEPGWQPRMKCFGEDRVTLLQYKSAMLSITNPPNPLLNYGKLLQQWIVDSYVQVEAQNLDYIRNHQNDLRVESYKGLMDYIHHKEKDQPVGRPIILPSSFEGSGRNMREKYLDAMAIVSHYGTPDLFITFTCNPKWREITENLLYNQTPSDRPELVSRVFHLKLHAFIDDIVKKEIFGPVLAYVFTIEFQKRGLPHAHMLFILKNKLKTAEQIDEIICAEIPNPADPSKQNLHNIVVKHMIHGPCAGFCLDQKGKCSKGFPKPFQSVTLMDRGGYPVYKRGNNIKVEKNGEIIDSSRVVPYNKFLTQKYNAHINVEACATVKSVKYIFKYIYKGYDCASVEIKHNEDTIMKYDEISHYLNCRYVCACEGAWRLFEFRMQERSHYVRRLAVHLPDEQSVIFKDGKEDYAATSKAESTLTAWFQLNEKDPNCNRYKYTEIPLHYVFDKKNKEWNIRKSKFNVVPRMYSVNPRNVELFHLRLLLLHCNGAKSFEDVRTIEGKTYESFQAAAMAKGLVKNNEACASTLEEMCLFEMPDQMRLIFGYMCIFCTHANAKALWNRFRDNLSEDFQRRYSYENALQKTLEKIDEILQLHGSSCEIFDLPINRKLITELTENENDLLSRPMDQSITNLIGTLNNAQLKIFNEIRDAYENKINKNKCFFIDGPGGCGKTYLYNVIIDYISSKRGIALSFATTGIASLLLVDGRTVHSGFKLPIPLLEDSTSFLSHRSKDALLLKKSDLIIIDECSMMDKFMLQCIERLLQFLMENDRVFGNKIIILGGDFRQTLPVVPRAHSSIIIERCLINSVLWPYFTKFSLTKNMRCVENTNFNEWLLKIGKGTVNDTDGMVEIPKKFLSTNIIQDIYGNDFKAYDIRSKIILCVKNSRALELNNEIISNLPGDEKIYYSADTIVSDDEEETERYPVDFLYSLTPSGMPPHELRLKVGTVVMLLRNLNLKAGLCNGTRMVIKKLYQNVIQCEILTGKNANNLVCIPQIDLIPSDTTLPFKLKRTQFPIIPAFVITINKSQGQTFDHVGLDLTEEVFSHGQLYTALSRITKEENLKIQLKDSTKTKNVVYFEIIET